MFSLESSLSKTSSYNVFIVLDQPVSLPLHLSILYFSLCSVFISPLCLYLPMQSLPLHSVVIYGLCLSLCSDFFHSLFLHSFFISQSPLYLYPSALSLSLLSVFIPLLSMSMDPVCIPLSLYLHSAFTPPLHSVFTSPPHSVLVPLSTLYITHAAYTLSLSYRIKRENNDMYCELGTRVTEF